MNDCGEWYSDNVPHYIGLEGTINPLLEEVLGSEDIICENIESKSSGGTTLLWTRV